MTEEEMKMAIEDCRRDRANIGTESYDGTAIFWHPEYNSIMFKAHRGTRKRIHIQMLQAGISLDGVSDRHLDIIYGRDRWCAASDDYLY